MIPSVSPPAAALPEDWLACARSVMARAPRTILGIAGTPGAGKSSLAAALVAALGEAAVLVPMDGFHLANSELKRLGRADRKGAPDTFDVAGYVALLRRLKNGCPKDTIYAPLFRRDLEEAIAGAIAVPPEVRLIVTEGNYLLLDQPGWRDVQPVLDACWYVDIDADSRVRRLVARHVEFGRTQAAATEWVMRSDEANARLITATRERADLVVRWPPAGASVG